MDGTLMSIFMAPFSFFFCLSSATLYDKLGGQKIWLYGDHVFNYTQQTLNGLSCQLELGGIPVHTEYRCLFFLRYEFLKYRNTGVI